MYLISKFKTFKRNRTSRKSGKRLFSNLMKIDDSFCILSTYISLSAFSNVIENVLLPEYERFLALPKGVLDSPEGLLDAEILKRMYKPLKLLKKALQKLYKLRKFLAPKFIKIQIYIDLLASITKIAEFRHSLEVIFCETDFDFNFLLLKENKVLFEEKEITTKETLKCWLDDFFDYEWRYRSIINGISNLKFHKF